MSNQVGLSRTRVIAAAAGSLFAVFSIFLLIGWRKWPDVFIDFGREMYLPWQMIEGRLIYRDIDHIFGPLSVFFNALVFRAAGVHSLTPLIVVNIALSSLFLTIVFTVLLKHAGLLSAWFGVLCTIVLNVLPHQTQVGNFNFITPYSHEAVHGVMLSFAALFLLWGNQGAKTSRISLSGFLTGMVLMTKPEVSAACVAACLWQLVFRSFLEKGWISKSIRAALTFTAYALLVPGAFLVYFAVQMGFMDALRALIGQWTLIFNGAFTSNVFYVVGSGFDKPLKNLGSAALGFLIVWIPYFLAVKKSRSNLFRYVIGLLTCVFITLFSRRVFEKTLIFADALFVLILAYEYLRWRKPKALDYSSLAVLAAALMGKLGLCGRFCNYGFYLGLPSVLLLAVMMLDYIPAWVAEKEGAIGASSVKVMSVLLLSGMFISGAVLSLWVYLDRNLEVGPPGDRIVTYDKSIDDRGSIAQGIYEWLSANAEKGSTLTVFPEGTLLNVWTGMASPARQIAFLPTETETYGEERMVAVLSANPPDYIVIWRRDVSMYGREPFGEESYGKVILDWISSAYKPVALIGKDTPDLRPSGAIILGKIKK